MKRKAPARACNTEPGRKLEQEISTPPGFESQPVVTGWTAGRSLFHDPLTGAHRLGDIRFHLERKLAACLVLGGTNGYPIQPHRIQNPHFRQLISYGMIFRNWGIKDLTECTAPLDSAASLVLLATLEKPVWGQADYLLLETLERMEQFQSHAWRGGRAL